MLLNIGGMQNLVVMPFVMVADWIAIATGAYSTLTFSLVHVIVAVVWSGWLLFVGLRTMFGTSRFAAAIAAISGEVVGVAILQLLAR